MNDSSSTVSLEKPSRQRSDSFPWNASTANEQRATMSLWDAPLLTGGQQLGQRITNNESEHIFEDSWSHGMTIRVSPLTRAKEPEKENAVLDDNRTESNGSALDTSPSSFSTLSTFSLPSEYTLYHSPMHDFGVAPWYSHTIDVTEAEKSLSAGMQESVDKVTTSTVDKPMKKEMLQNHPTHDTKRETNKEFRPPPNETIIPTDLDVLCGRGPTVTQHPGNRVFHRIKHELQDEYFMASNSHKTIISQELVNRILRLGGRFLKKEEAGWVTVNNKCARDKAAQALRTVELTKEERSARRTFFMTEKDIVSNKRLVSDLTAEEVAARILFERIRDRQGQTKYKKRKRELK